MPSLVCTVVNPVVTPEGASLTVEVRLKSDLGTDPPRASFPLRMPPEANASALRAAVENGTRQAYQAYLDNQTAATRSATVLAFLTGKTYAVEV